MGGSVTLVVISLSDFGARTRQGSLRFFPSTIVKLNAITTPRTFKNVLKFKTKNDTYVYAIGEELLIIVPQRTKGALREMDTLARIGGDEFIAVITNVAKNEDYKQTLRRLLLVMKFALDDVATRYSSLTYLRRLPASLIKVEQSSLHFA